MKKYREIKWIKGRKKLIEKKKIGRLKWKKEGNKFKK